MRIRKFPIRCTPDELKARPVSHDFIQYQLMIRINPRIEDPCVRCDVSELLYAGLKEFCCGSTRIQLRTVGHRNCEIFQKHTSPNQITSEKTPVFHSLSVLVYTHSLLKKTPLSLHKKGSEHRLTSLIRKDINRWGAGFWEPLWLLTGKLWGSPNPVAVGSRT